MAYNSIDWNKDDILTAMLRNPHIDAVAQLCGLAKPTPKFTKAYAEVCRSMSASDLRIVQEKTPSVTCFNRIMEYRKGKQAEEPAPVKAESVEDLFQNTDTPEPEPEQAPKAEPKQEKESVQEAANKVMRVALENDNKRLADENITLRHEIDYLNERIKACESSLQDMQSLYDVERALSRRLNDELLDAYRQLELAKLKRNEGNTDEVSHG